ncbi:hypothetical protein BU104_12610 [Staphylococcus xylosus]|uniref:Uncharacterized protein n=1 Tax=Staphylococcus xylosus TaxID=1288 RepID=A0AAQ0LW77_STAXY|nr:hypothetical protein [Staphylococcus xylosus]RIM90968.1 hypothetical protein BU104_12610 [Staphylococcus xylosus]
MKTTINKQHRKSLLNNLTENQRNVLRKHYKANQNNDLFNTMYNNSDDWEFVDLIIDEDYNSSDSHNSLYCECGRKLKYQYVLYSKEKSKNIKLGITHFTEHTNIPQNVANQVKSNLFKIDSWLDDILLSNEQFKLTPSLKDDEASNIKYYKNLNEKDIEEFNNQSRIILTSKDKNIIDDFYQHNIALPSKTHDVLESINQFHRNKYRVQQLKAEKIRQEEQRQENKQIFKRRINNKKFNNQIQKTNKKKRKYSDSEIYKKKLIAECRIAITNQLKSSERLSMKQVYEHNKVIFDNLLSIISNKEIVREIVKSINRYSIYNIEYSSGFLKKINIKNYR